MVNGLSIYLEPALEIIHHDTCPCATTNLMPSFGVDGAIVAPGSQHHHITVPAASISPAKTEYRKAVHTSTSQIRYRT